MDRLLTDEEIRGIVQNTPAGVYDYKAVAQAQDDLTAHLVARQIFKELEDLIPMFYINHAQDYQAIKSKWEK